MLRWGMKFRPNTDNVPFERQREIINGLMERLPGPKVNSYQETTIAGIPALRIIPPTPSQQVLLYFHGGAYTVGSRHTERMIAGNIAAQSGATVLVPEYRLAPEHPFPAALDDAVACYEFLLSSAVQTENLIVGGLSAGGGLTAALLLKLRELDRSLPRAAVLLSPWLDLTGTAVAIKHNAALDSGLSWELLIPSVKAYAGEHDLRHPLISPVFAELQGLPPLLIQVGDIEILLDDARQFAAKAEAAGVHVQLRLWEGMIHAWHVYRIIPEARRAVDEIVAFLRSYQNVDR